MAEEFQESEVVFSDEHYNKSSLWWSEEMAGHESSGSNYTRRGKKRKQKKPGCSSSSVPVNIPSRVFRIRDDDNDQFEEEDEDGKLVPPHVIIGRRVEGKGMAFSVCSGNGRTLKGRDLSEVRNSILKLTGFLET